MGSIVLIMPKYEDAARIRDIIRRSGQYTDLEIAGSRAEVLRFAEERELSLVICTPRFCGMGYEELVNDLPARIPVLLLTKNAALVPFSDSVIKLLMPFRADDLLGTLQTILPVQHRSSRARQNAGHHSSEHRRPQRTPEQQKLLDDAKQLLMTRNDMTEPEAFRYLQKTSMDTGRTLIETAQMVLYVYNG